VWVGEHTLLRALRRWGLSRNAPHDGWSLDEGDQDGRGREATLWAEHRTCCPCEVDGRQMRPAVAGSSFRNHF
jgi:hypothetical protein